MIRNRTDFYQNYCEWKSWQEESEGSRLSEGYKIEVGRSGVKPGAAILEVGFGNGAFLDWARDHGYEVSGIEIIPELVDRARTKGHDVYHGDIVEVFAGADRRFDLIVMFDVLEHLSIDEIIAVFPVLKSLLPTDGAILARFPNGASPFGRAYQYGDITHQSVLTGSSINQIAMRFGMQVIFENNAARCYTGPRHGGPKSWTITRGLAYGIREIIQRTISLVYFGRNVPFDPNLTVIIRNKPSAG